MLLRVEERTMMYRCELFIMSVNGPSVNAELISSGMQNVVAMDLRSEYVLLFGGVNR
jgi:hypothetical protein